MSESLWERVADCFNQDDGSLPGIFVAKLSIEGVAGVYAMLRSRSRLAGESAPEFWSVAKEASMIVDSVPNAAALVASGKAEAFHLCVAGLVAGGVELPVLGIFVWQDAVELDYRMGPDWGPSEVAGIFELLRDCCAVDPGAIILLPECEGPPYPERFLQAWVSYNKGECHPAAAPDTGHI